MDPNECLRRIRAAVAGYNGDMTLDEVAEELAPLVEALDEWISKGGYLPKAWNVERTGVETATYHITYPGSVSNPTRLFRVVKYSDYLTWFNAPADRRELFPVPVASEHKTFAEAEAACDVLNGVRIDA